MRVLPQAARYYLAGLWCTALFLSAALFFFPAFWPKPLELPQILSALIFAVMLTVADVTAIHVEEGRTISVAVAVIIAGLTALNLPLLLLAIVIGTVSAAVAGNHPWWQQLSKISVRWITVSVGLFIAHFSGTLSTSTYPYITLPALFSLVVTGALFYLLERAVETGMTMAVERRSWRESWTGRLDDLSWYTLMLAPLGGLLAILWKIKIWVFFLGIVPIAVVQRAFQSQVELSKRSREVQDLHTASIALNSKLEHLQNLALTLIATRDVPTLLETLCNRLAALLNASNGWVVLMTDEQQPVVVATHNLPVEPTGPGPHMVPWPQSYEPVLSRQRVVVFTDQRVRKLAPTALLSEGQYWNALIVIPLASEQRVLGAICLTFIELRGLNENEQRILTAFARQAATVLENARLFREVQESQARLIQASKMEALGTFSAGIAHEFNNLLAGVLGYAQLGMASEDVGTKNESLKVVVDTCKRGKSITGGLLTFARRREHRRDMGDIREVVEATTTLMEIELRKSKIMVERRINPVPPTFCDTGQISQVVLNLLTNARDAMKPNGGTLTIDLSSTDEHIILRVSDTGCGIPEAIRDKIFEPFVTTKGALGGSQTPGTGLGLSVSYGIVKEHGGTFEIDSSVAVGTTMIVCLPIIVETPPTPEVPPVPVPEEVPTLRMLVVDDDPTVANSLQGLMERAGHEVVVSNDATQALHTYRNDHFDIVLTDLAMPGMNGIGLVRALNALDPDATVIVFTGQASEQQVDQALQAGAVGVLHKPFELQEVLNVIKNAWSHKREGVLP